MLSPYNILFVGLAFDAPKRDNGWVYEVETLPNEDDHRDFDGSRALSSPTTFRDKILLAKVPLPKNENSG